MTNITITIPEDKVTLVTDAIKFYIGNEQGEEFEFSKAIAVTWLKGKLKEEVKRLVKNYQQSLYNDDFIFDDPLE